MPLCVLMSLPSFAFAAAVPLDLTAVGPGPISVGTVEDGVTVTWTARSIGDRVEILFDGLGMGVFDGGVAYTFFPGSLRALAVETAGGSVAVFPAPHQYFFPLAKGEFFTTTGEVLLPEVDLSSSTAGRIEARVAVWDVAGNGAFVNPVWRMQ